jgi:hypothetical protein
MNTETPMILSDGEGPGKGIVEVYTNKRIAVIDDDEKITFHPSLKLIDVFAYIHARRTVKRLSEWILKGEIA